MKDRKHFKFHHTLIFLLILSLSGCASSDATLKDEDNNSDEVEEGIGRPAIVYNGALFLLDSEKATSITMQEGFIDSQKKIETCAENTPVRLTEELSTSRGNCYQVGFSIFFKPDDENKLLTAKDYGDGEYGSYTLYEKYDEPEPGIDVASNHNR